MSAEAKFLNDLAEGITIATGGRYTQAGAVALAGSVWQRLKEIGTDAFPCMLEEAGLRFVYQWDEAPQILTVMLWDEVMWRDMVRIEVPPEIAPE